MKKIKIAITTAAIIYVTSCSIIHALPKPRPISEATILGQQLIRELSHDIRKANDMYDAAASISEKEEITKNAREAAQNLVEALNDVKTFGTDVIRGYHPKQIQIAAITLANRLIRLNIEKIKIKSRRTEIAGITNIGVLIDTAVSGKEAERNQAIRDQQYNHKVKNDIQSAIEYQEEILGPKWTNAIKSVIYNLLVGNSLGICYDIDWSFGAHNTSILERSHHGSDHAQGSSSRKLTKKQHAAIKSWHHLSKSKLLSKDLASTEEVIQAKDLLKKLEYIREDLKNVPTKAKYKDIVHRVNKSIDSLSHKIETTKTRWLKVV